MKMDFKNIKKFLLPALIVIILLLIAGGLYYLAQKKKNILSADESAAKVIDFINKKLLQGQATAVLKSVTEESGVYKILFTVEGQEYTFYNTKDGKLVFTSGGAMPEETTEESNQQQQETSTSQSQIAKKDKSQALLFVMSYCPYGNQAEELMMPVAALLGDKADIQVHYVIYSNYSGGGPKYCLDKDNKYCSMHGIQELNQDVRELCVQKYQKDKFWDFVKAMNSSCTSSNADSCWENVAKGLGINIEQVKNCQKNEAITILEQEVQLNKKYGVTGSPQLVINDKEYNGTRSAEAYKSAICSGFNNPPAECSQQVEGAQTTAPAGGCQ